HSIQIDYFEKDGSGGIQLEYEVGGQRRTLTGPMGLNMGVDGDGGLGKDIDVDGDTLGVGVPGGKVNVYRRSGELWNLQQTLTGSGGFGSAVAVSGTKLVVGMPSADGFYASAGQPDTTYNLNLQRPGGAVVYSYNTTSSSWVQDRLLMPDDSSM